MTETMSRRNNHCVRQSHYSNRHYQAGSARLRIALVALGKIYELNGRYADAGTL